MCHRYDHATALEKSYQTFSFYVSSRALATAIIAALVTTSIRTSLKIVVNFKIINKILQKIGYGYE